MTHSTRQNILDLGFSRHDGRIKRAVDAVLACRLLLLCEILQCGLGLGTKSRVIVFAVFVSSSRRVRQKDTPGDRHACTRSSSQRKASLLLLLLSFFSSLLLSNTHLHFHTPPSLQTCIFPTAASLDRIFAHPPKRGIPRALLPRCCIPRHYHLLVDCISQSAWWKRARYNATCLCLA